jgi:hypothetical protein
MGSQIMKNQQKLYWSVSKPICYLGLTIDEWGALFVGLVPGVFMINGENFKIGMIFIIGGCFSCYLFKKFKGLSRFFLLKSWLLSKGLISAPSKNYPHMLNKTVGK